MMIGISAGFTSGVAATAGVACAAGWAGPPTVSAGTSRTRSVPDPDCDSVFSLAAKRVPVSGGTTSVGVSVATGSGLIGVNRRGCENSVGASVFCAIRTRTPTLVVLKRLTANDPGIRMHPCDAGWPGNTPSCIATPDQVMRCMNGIGAPL